MFYYIEIEMGPGRYGTCDEWISYDEDGREKKSLKKNEKWIAASN